MGVIKENMKSANIRLAAVGTLAVLLGFWTTISSASMDLSPQPHLSDIDLQQDELPTPAALRDNVSFWSRVFAEWRLSQVVLHDADYPGLVYEVINLDGKVGDVYSTDQTKQIRLHREALEGRLARIEAAGADADRLNEQDRALRQNIIDVAGINALADVSSRVRAQRGLRERFLKGLEISGRYDKVFRQVFREEGVPEDLAYLPHVESSFQNHARSSVGATGMWQFTRSAGRLFMTVNHVVDQRLDPVLAARGAARYLRQAYQMLGSWPLAVTSYNHGIQGMMRAKNQFGTDFDRIVTEYDSRTFGFASRNFYAEFLAARRVARQYDLFFPEGVALQHPLELDSVVLDRTMRSHELARFYSIKQSELVALNPSWSTNAARGGLALPVGAIVWLPAGTLTRKAENTDGQIAEGEPRSSSEAAAIGDAPEPVSIFHIVRPNESLSVIAKRYDLSIKTLRALNDISPDKDLVRVGQKLRVRDAVEPAVGGEKESEARFHVVRKGDTAWDIATNYGISLKELMVSNQLTKRSKLHPGQRLEIPVNR